MSSHPDRSAQVVAWDLPTRLFHWALVLGIASAWISYRFAETLGDPTLVWHRWIGLTIMILLVWRLLWGLFGSSTSRFASFLRSPRAALQYARDLAAGGTKHYLGHNPLGAYMVMALLGVLLLQASFGLFSVDDNDLTGGPLYRLVSEEANKWATRWHGRIFDFAILPLGAIHIATNALYGALKKEPLITAMITGAKPAMDYEDAAAAVIPDRPLMRAALCLVAAAAIVLGTTFGLGGKL
jgi:cytochrome b